MGDAGRRKSVRSDGANLHFARSEIDGSVDENDGFGLGHCFGELRIELMAGYNFDLRFRIEDVFRHFFGDHATYAVVAAQRISVPDHENISHAGIVSLIGFHGVGVWGHTQA